MCVCILCVCVLYLCVYISRVYLTEASEGVFFKLLKARDVKAKLKKPTFEIIFLVLLKSNNIRHVWIFGLLDNSYIR